MTFAAKAVKMKFSEGLPDILTISETLSTYFDKDRIEQEAKDSKFIQKPKQLTGTSFFCICIMQGFGASLEMMCSALSGFSVMMCGQSLNERFTDKAVGFMKRMFEQMLKLELSKTAQMDFLSKFNGVYIQDSTVIKLPEILATLFKGTGGSAGASSAKVDFQMDAQGDECHMEIRAGVSADSTLSVKTLKKGGLYIRDLGYYNIMFFQMIIESGAYFLSRFKSKSVVYSDSCGKIELNIGKMAKKMVPNETLHIPVFIGLRKFVPVFLIVQKLPPEIVSIKVEKAKKDHHKRMTKMTRVHTEWCEFNSYITNIPIDWFNALTIIKIYGLRWQIEIMFKVWKSIFKIGEIGKMNANRVLCFLYGRLIWILLQMKVFRAFKKNIYGVTEKEVSEISAYKHMDEHKAAFRDAIISNLIDLWQSLIQILFDIIQRFAIKKRRKKKMPLLYEIDFKVFTN